jgi:UDP-glucose 4-epimerase
MSSVLVTGGAGFIGSHLAEALVRRGHSVVVLDDLSGGFADNLPGTIVLTRGSILDVELLNRLFVEHVFDYVYHLAAYAAEGLSHFIKRFNYTNNVVGSVNLINAAVNFNVKGFVFTSSIAVYGDGGGRPMDEATRPQPQDSYGIAKFAVEQELGACRDMFGLDYIIFRPHNVYGPRQNIGDRYRNVVGIFMNQILQGKPMTIFGDGTQTRAFSYIDDVVPAMAEAIEKPDAWNQIFNIGADQPYALNDLARRVAGVMNVEPAIVYLPARHEVHHAHSTHQKVRQVFGRQRETSLEDGLRTMAAWVRTRGARSSMPYQEIEVPKNLPAVWLEA